MTSAIPKSKSYGAVASGRSSPTFPSLPIDIVRLVFEVSVTPSLRAGDEQQRQRTAYALCLVSKNVKDWVEPLLYEKVVLESREQVIGFLIALEIKPATFLARGVKTVWILNEELPRDTADHLSILFSKCPLLERFTIIDSWLSMRILQSIPELQSGPYVLQELTIIKASSATARSLDLTHFAIQKLHLIDCSPAFFDTLYKRALDDNVLLDKLRAIPQIFLDCMAVRSVELAASLKFRAISLWIPPSPESISVLHIRTSSTPPARRNHSLSDYRPVVADFYLRNRANYTDDADSWVKCFDSDVQRCGAKLVVNTKSEVEVRSKNNTEASYIDRCKAWFGLD